MKALINKNRDLTLVEDLEEPSRGKNEVKVQVHYASLNPTDADIAKGDLDFLLWLFRVRSPVRTGLEFSGTVINGGDRYATGTRVFGYTNVLKGPKTHQGVISIPENYIAAVPDTMSLAEAAAFPLGAQTSFVALRDVAKVKPGQSVLISGGSGGLGLYAIQFARNMGVKVTGVAGPQGQKIMADLGANETVNYRETPLSQLNAKFDAVLEFSDTYRFGDLRRLLVKGGVFVPADPLKNMLGFAGNLFRSTKMGYLLVDRGENALLADLASQVEQGALQTPQFREFPIEAYRDAFEALRRPGGIGRIVLKFL